MNSKNIYIPSKRLANVKFSPIRKVLERAKELEENGSHIIHFEIGEPDFNSPNKIIENTVDALNNNMTHYSSNRGLINLRKEIANKFYSRTNIQYSADSEVLITVGASEALNIALFALLDENDEVIIFSPAFMNYKNLVEMTLGKAVIIDLKKENNFQIDIDEIKNNISKNTKIIILNNPCNPTGIVQNENILEKIAKIAIEHNLIIISDEIYDEIIYDKIECKSIAQFPGMKERAIIINGFSKTYAMTGWRLGYLLCDARFMASLLKVHQYNTNCVSTFIQEGVRKGMVSKECKEEIKKMVSLFEKRRDLLIEGLLKINNVSFIKPDGTFYLFLDIEKTGLDGDKFAERLLEEKKVALVSGTGFGEKFKNYVRISFATSEKNISLGIEKIAEFIGELIN